MSGNAWTPARARRLDELSGPDGIIVGSAVDHRDSLRLALKKKGLADVTSAELSALKLRIARALAPASTLILMDVEYSAAQALAAGVIPGSVALGVPLEAQGYGEVADAPRTTFLPGWSPEQAAKLGASACKLLLPYRVDVAEQAAGQDEVVPARPLACAAAHWHTGTLARAKACSFAGASIFRLAHSAAHCGVRFGLLGAVCGFSRRPGGETVSRSSQGERRETRASRG